MAAKPKAAAGDGLPPRPPKAKPNRKQQVELFLGDGTYLFKPGIGGVEAIQEACDAGPPLVLERLSTGRWRLEDIVAPIRYGLEGGGMSPGRVVFMIDRYVHGQPLAESVPIAQAVMLAVIVGIEEEPLKKGEAPTRKNPSKTEKSASEPSTSKADG